MSEIHLQIDGQAVTASEGMTLLEAARSAGIEIPTLCYHEKLEPYGGCRLCIVEVEERGRTKLVVSCVFPAASGLVVHTRSEKIDRIRRMILELQLAHAPDAFELQKLAKEYGADPHRFEKEASFCIHCGLCVRYCAEVKQEFAVGFVDRGTSDLSAFRFHSRRIHQPSRRRHSPLPAECYRVTHRFHSSRFGTYPKSP